MSVVGIDLGTTNTVAACVRAGRVHVLADDEGHRLLPSVVSFHPSGDVLVGYGAKERRLVDAKNTIASVKRLIGRSWQSPDLARARQRFAFEMKEGPGHAPLVVSRGQEYTLPEISAFVLKRAKQIAEAALGDAVEKAVITVPANFNELQRASTKVAGRVAGLEVLRILNEPTAAALAYGFGRGGHERIAVYDFGGGTFDCTLLDLSGNVFEVLATAGDSFLGGDDIDSSIAERMADAFLLQHRFDPRQDGQSFERLRVYAEQIKMTLSKSEHSEVHLREMAFGVGGAHLDLRFGLSRHELESLVEPYLERTLKVCQESLALAGLPVSSFDKVILVGGSTRIPLVRKRVEQFFGTQPLDRINPDEVVGIGAAIQAAALTDLARRRSIPPPPPSRQRVATLRGINEEGDAARAAAAAAGMPIGRVALSRTQRMSSAPAVPPLASAPAAPQAPPRVREPLPSIPELEVDIDESKEITRVFSAPIGDLAEGYANLAPTSPSVPPPPASDMLTTSMPLSTPRPPPPPQASHLDSDLAPTVPGARAPAGPPLFISAPSLLDPPPELIDTRPGDSPTRPGADPPTRPLLPPIAPPMTFSGPAHAPPIFPTPTPGAAFPPVTPAPSPAARTMNLPAPRVSYTAPPPALAPILIDVTPRALVVETVGGFCDTIIPRNAKIPCQRTRAFSPGRDYQSAVRIRIAQGEDPTFSSNTYLGEIELTGLRSALRGEVTIAIAFEVDANGIVQVRATDVLTGREARAMLQLIGVAQEEAILHMAERTASRRVGAYASAGAAGSPTGPSDGGAR